MSNVIRFANVSKRYSRRRTRPSSLRGFFVRMGPFGRRVVSGSERSSDLWALRDVSFDIRRGETVGLIGSNGAGKSTTLKLLSHVIAPTSGQIQVEGRVGALLELGAGFHPELSGRDNVFLTGALIGMGRQDVLRKFDSIVAFSELEEFIDMPVKHYSSGMFARLAFAVNIHLDPEILLVDEVLAVGDRNFQFKCLDQIARMQREGVTICFVSHSLDLVRWICSRALWFEHGHIRDDGPAEAVAERYLEHAVQIESERVRDSATGSVNRWGRGDIEIVSVHLTDSDGRERATFATGDPLFVHIAYQAARCIDAPVFGLAIHRSDGLHIAGPNTAFDKLDFDSIQNTGKLVYAIPELCLLDGLYSVSVSVHHRNGIEMYDYHDRAYTFHVVNASRGIQERYGVLTLRGHWQHLPDQISR